MESAPQVIPTRQELSMWAWENEAKIKADSAGPWGHEHTYLPYFSCAGYLVNSPQLQALRYIWEHNNVSNGNYGGLFSYSKLPVPPFSIGIVHVPSRPQFPLWLLS